MFRPNRIGTPRLYQTTIVDNTSNWTPNSNLAVLPIVTGNVINASPLADFGFTNLTWDGVAETLTLSHKIALLQQFAITQPLAGDTVGLELEAHLDILLNKPHMIVPIFTRLTAAGGAVLASVTTGAGIGARRIGPASYGVAQATQLWSAADYVTQCVQNDSVAVNGIYGHGFLIYLADTADTTLTAFHMQAGVRQLNDQQSVGYRDTLR